MWDTLSGEAAITLSGHTGDVFCVAASADGHTVYTGSGDETVR